MAYYPEDEDGDNEEEKYRKSQLSIINPPEVNPEEQAMEAKLKSMEDPERVARNAQARADEEKLNPTIDPNYQVDDVAPVPPPIDDVQTQDVLAPTLEQLESDANRQYDDALQQGRLRANEAKFGSNISYAGELLNQAFAGGPKTKPIDPFFQWLQQGAGQIGQDAEKDADRALRLELQKIRTLRQSKDLDDPASPANRAAQAMLIERAKDLGYSGDRLAAFSSQISQMGGGSLKEASKQLFAGDSAARGKRHADIREVMAHEKMKNDAIKLGFQDQASQLAYAKYNKALEDHSEGALADYAKAIEKTRIIPVVTALKSLDALLPGAAKNVVTPEARKAFSLAENAGSYADQVGQGIGQRLGLTSADRAKINVAYNTLANQYINAISGAAVSDPEMQRLQSALQKGVFTTPEAKLFAIDLLRQIAANQIRNQEIAYMPQIEQGSLDLALEQGLPSTRDPLFGGVFQQNVQGDVGRKRMQYQSPLPGAKPALDTSIPVQEPAALSNNVLTPEERAELEALKRELGQ